MAQNDQQECKIISNLMAANTKDCRCRELPNHLQNAHLFRYTLLTVKYTALFHKRQNNDQNLKRRPHKTSFLLVPSLQDISQGEKAVFGRPKFMKFFWEDTFSQFRTVNQTYLRTKTSFKNFLSYTLRNKLKIGKKLRLPENINKSDHLLLCL